MKIVIVVLALLLIGEDALARQGAAWHEKRVRVWNHAGVEWEPALRQAVAEVNASLPKRAPRFVYRQGGTDCRGHRRAITVCSSDTLANPGETVTTWRKRRILRSRITLRPFVEFDTHVLIACHELFHAVTLAPESAVPDGPCPFDEPFARKTYRKHGATNRRVSR